MGARRERNAAVRAMLAADPTRSSDGIAAAVGVAPASVRRIRRAMGVAPPPRSPTPPAVIRRALAKATSDRQAAEVIGVSVSAVRVSRRKQGIPSRYRATVAARHADIIARVGRGHNDCEIARDIGMSVAGVRAVRVKAGLPPNADPPTWTRKH